MCMCSYSQGNVSCDTIWYLQTALERQDLSCMSLAHHELESIISISIGIGTGTGTGTGTGIGISIRIIIVVINHYCY